MKISHQTINQETKKVFPLFTTLKPLILSKNKEKLDKIKEVTEKLKISGEICHLKSSKNDEKAKSDTSTENSIKSRKNTTSSPENQSVKMKTKKFKSLKKRNFVQKDGHFNTGRWQKDEHERFIEAILKFGNEWKKVQKYVKTRSSTQARSHAQKFLYKVNKSNLLDLDFDFNKNSLKSLHDLESKMEEDKYANAIKVLSLIGFEKSSNCKIKSSSRNIKISTDDFNYINKNPFSISNTEIDDNFLFSEENIKENFCEFDFNSESVQDEITETIIQNYCMNNKKNDLIMKKSRKNSKELFTFYNGYNISYCDLNTSYFNDYDCDEEKNFQKGFDNFFNLNKNSMSEDNDDLNNLLFLSMGKEIIQSENSCHDKLNISIPLIEQPSKINLLNKKRKIFQINSSSTQNKTTLKSSKKIKFVTYNYPHQNKIYNV